MAVLTSLTLYWLLGVSEITHYHLGYPPPLCEHMFKCKQTELSLPGVRKPLAEASLSAGHSLALSADPLASRSSSVCRSPIPYEQQSSGAGSSARGPTRSWLFSEHPSITEREDQIELWWVGVISYTKNLAKLGRKSSKPMSALERIVWVVCWKMLY